MYQSESESNLIAVKVMVVDADGNTHEYEELYASTIDAQIDADQRYPGARRIEVKAT